MRFGGSKLFQSVEIFPLIVAMLLQALPCPCRDAFKGVIAIVEEAIVFSQLPSYNQLFQKGVPVIFRCVAFTGLYGDELGTDLAEMQIRGET